MILLPSATPPASTDALRSALRALLSQVVAFVNDPVRISGQFPALETLVIDLTNATPLDHPAARGTDSVGPVVGQFSADRFELLGQPFGDAARPVHIQASARNCRGEFLQANNNQTALRIAAADDGHLRLAVTRLTVQSIMLAEASKVARQQGVDIKDVQITWHTDTPRTLSAQVLIKAKKSFLPTATLRVTGRLSIDQSLTATLSNLSVEGEGMVGSLGAGLIRPKLQQAEGMTRSLLALPLDAVKIQDVRLLAAPDSLIIEADFAG
jgi:hypothetical protein